MKNILVVVESIDTDKSSGAKANFALIQNLASLGYKIKVLHYSRKHIKIKGAVLEEITEKKFSLLYFFSRFQRIVSRWLKIDFSVVLENLFGHSFTFFNDCKSIKGAITKNYNDEDLIITLSQGASFRPHYALLKLPQLHSKWLAYVHDPYPFHYYPRPYNWVEKGYRFKESFFKQVSETAKYSAFPSKLLKEWMGSYFPNFLKTGIIIPHQNIDLKQDYIKVNPDYFDPLRFNLLHAGNLMKQRDPRGLIEGYKLFLENNPEAKRNSKLILLGPGGYHKTYLEENMCGNIYWSKGGVDFNEVYQMQSKTSVNIILEAISEISPFLPGKFPHCIYARKPILHLGPFHSETRNLLGKDFNYSVESDKINEIYNKISLLFENWKNNSEQEFYRPDLEEYLSKGELLNKINEL